ncbi:MAG: type II toxin-antitoxin system PemK/MazF family toxin [Prosthecobacter sp.]|uniref:type II toxin-antitoxin system PemK/MazF family toxin n=1 Tax=Prosthecobacter sp. TaxID=1965333 RepID=UPI0039010173
MKPEPLRGEVWLADLGMAAKVRPVLIVSASLEPDDYALIMVIPHTTSSHPSRHSVALAAHGLKEGSFNLQGMLAVPLAKFIRRMSVLTSVQMRDIDQALKKWLCLE